MLRGFAIRNDVGQGTKSFSTHSITGGSLADTWEESLRRFVAATDTSLVSGDTAGDFIDWEGVTLIALYPQAELKISSKYQFPDLVSDYRNYFGGGGAQYQDFATITDRLFAWPLPDGTTLNQIKMIKDELRADRGSRRAMASVWNPAEDMADGHPAPLGQCFFHFAVRDGQLNMTVVSRSVDAWIGQVPNMVAFAQLQQQIADDTGYPVGRYRQFILSYHVYLTNLPLVYDFFTGSAP